MTSFVRRSKESPREPTGVASRRGRSLKRGVLRSNRFTGSRELRRRPGPSLTLRAFGTQIGPPDRFADYARCSRPAARPSSRRSALKSIRRIDL